MRMLADTVVFGHHFKISVAFVVSFILLVLGTALCFRIGERRPKGTPLTWGEALLGGTFVFGLMVLAYGVVPNQWILWADKQLLWRSDKLLFAVSSKGLKFGKSAASIGGSGRILVSYLALRDVIAALIYVVFLGAHVALWSRWQKRGLRTAPAEVERSSAFGRPLVRKA
ncbi:MAG: hypothetical protein ACYDAD_09675 [Acidimicrobiales bacterium]